MLDTVARLFEALRQGRIGYCHWKSNWILEETIAGKTDLDLLVDRGDAPAFRRSLQELGFRPSIELGVASFPSVEHYHALDPESTELVHVHAYYRVITGDSLTKNYRLPLESVLLSNVRSEGVVTVPSRGAELVVFVLRMSVKHASLGELALLLRSWDDVRREAVWLATDDARAEARVILAASLPSFDGALFEQALSGLLEPAPLLRRVVLGRRVRAQLRPFARRGRARAWLARTRALGGRAIHRLRGRRKGLAPASGGAVIAIVGVEASGKSTLLENLEGWLASHYAVSRVHAGKPPVTVISAVPNLFLPALRALVPGQRSTKVSARLAAVAVGENEGSESGGKTFPLLFGLRSALLAHDRRVLLTRSFVRSANGEIVLCDRYPSSERGAVDGAQLSLDDSATPGGLRRWLSAFEARQYRKIPPPDLVIRLTAPLEVTLERNRSRTKVEPDDYVRSRYARSVRTEFHARVEDVDTNRPIDESARDVRRLVWEAL